MAEGTVRVKGLRELDRSFRRMSKDLTKELRGELREAGNIVRDDARIRFAKYDERSAAGYRTAVRARGVAVEQRLGRTTGKRPDFGRLQMRRALSPALDAKSDEVANRVDKGLDRLAGREGF